MSLLVATSATSSEWNGAERVRLHVNYVRSLEGAGLVPLVVPPLADASRAGAILDACGGLLLTGGEDVDPSRYGAARHEKTDVPNVPRDATELALLTAARERRIPVLAICRGIQLVNVALGGSLVQDLPSERPSPVRHNQPDERGIRTHDVEIVPGSRLADAIGATSISVNSYHHQSVDRVAHGLKVVATAPDFVVEGLEADDPEWWMLAVQWHPEDLTTDTRTWDRGLFRAFSQQASKRASEQGNKSPAALAGSLAR